MTKVSLLPEDVISKIAAGEVIERPASVVKELLENALDAQSDSVEIHLQSAGKTLIQIKDNGSGIEKDDLEKIFLRHSTSKISNFDDLHSIHSLGFRGEALYSIGAIADVTLRSKTADQDSGWEIHMRGGKKIDFKPVTMNNGTEIEVRELFFNTPARRKFLKSNTTELNQILNIVIPHALLNETCRIVLKHQDKTLLDLRSRSSQVSRIAQTLNLDEKHMIETENSHEESGVSIKMVLGDINITRSQRDMQFIFVNERPVQNKAISFHMNQIYQLVFPPKRFSFFAVMINIPSEDVDVNIHPTKREVKIKNEGTLTSILRHMCEHALMSSSSIKQALSPQSRSQENVVDRALVGTHRSAKDFETALPSEIFEATSKDSTVPSSSDQYAFPTSKNMSADEQSTMFSPQKDNLKSKLEHALYIGSAMKKFLLFESGKSLLVVDQHAAQERIVFEKLSQQMQDGTVEVQHLLAPITIKLSVQDINAWEEAKDRLDKFGFSSTQFDDETIAVHTYPVLLKEPELGVRHLLSGENIAHCDHETVARRACKASIRAGDNLNREQVEFQREQLIQCKDPFTCPHGRPTVIEMTEGFLDKQFLRT